MRTAALLALTLVLLALGMRIEPSGANPATPDAVTAGQGGAQIVRIFSTGWTLKAPTLGRISHGRGIMVDGKTYVGKVGKPCLEILELHPDGSLSDLHAFDLRNDPDAIEGLETYTRGVETDTVLAMRVNATIGLKREAGRESRQRVANLFAFLGVKTRPWEFNFQSFAYLGLRTETGFQPVAETFSVTQGIALTYSLPADRSTLLGREVRAFVDNRVKFRLPVEPVEGEGLLPGRTHQVGAKLFPGIKGTTRHGAPARVRWRLEDLTDLKIADSAPVFEARIATAWGADNRLRSARFVLKVNGEEVGDRIILRDASEMVQWLRWEQTLGKSKEDIREIEVEVQWVGQEGGAPLDVFIATPTLTSGVARTL